MTEDKDFEEHSKNESLKRQEQNNTDLQNEIADRYVGRQTRFFAGGSSASNQSQKKEEEKQQLLSRLALMLQDTAYATLYQQVIGNISKASLITENEIHKANLALEEHNTELEQMLREANKSADGHSVFKDKNGNVRDINGTIITDQVILDGIVWKDNAPSYEDYMAKEQAIIQTQNNIDALRHYEVEVIGVIRDRMSNEDYPFSKEELEKAQRDIYEQAPESVQKRFEASGSDHVSTASHEVSILKM